MNVEAIKALLRSALPAELLAKPGAVLASGANTLAAGHAYVMGLNPGGDPSLIPTPMIEAIAPADGTSAYTHECWQPHCAQPPPCTHVDLDGRTRQDALVRHQRNMSALAEALGAAPADLFSANAVFARSTSRATLRSQTGLGLHEWWRVCWPVHQRFLDIVRPHLLVTLGYGEGSSAFGLLRAVAGSPAPSRIGEESRRGGWCFDARLPIAGGDILQCHVVGAPHPSYFAPGPELSARLAEHASPLASDTLR